MRCAEGNRCTKQLYTVVTWSKVTSVTRSWYSNAVTGQVKYYNRRKTYRELSRSDLRDDRRDVVVLFLRAESSNPVHDGSQQILARQFPMSAGKSILLVSEKVKNVKLDCVKAI